MQLSKTNFLQYLTCAKSLWLLKHKPRLYPHQTVSNYEEKLAQEGYEVQKLVEGHLLQDEGVDKYTFNKVYKTNQGLYAEADIIRQNDDGTVNIYEVKSSSSVSKAHLTDATFQTIVLERSGIIVKSIYIVHLNKEYVRSNILNWLELTSDWAMTLDVPTWAADELNSGKSGLNSFQDCLDATVFNNDSVSYTHLTLPTSDLV